MAEKVYIILVNWNGWRDTIECLESVFHLDYPNYEVVVCDNASSDGSLEQIGLWARGETHAISSSPALAHLINPPVRKPIAFTEYSHTETKFVLSAADTRLTLIQTGSNLGFAGGNNVGLRYALAQEHCDFAWLLNNDTVVQPDALSRLIDRMRQQPEVGICGSTLRDYFAVDRIQACGGASYNRWLARGTHLARSLRIDQMPDAKTIETEMAYVVGASMLVRRSFLEQVGLLNEEYFLYFEELDWAIRALGRFTLAYSPLSVVYHKEGRSIGSSSRREERSSASERYAANRGFGCDSQRHS